MTRKKPEGTHKLVKQVHPSRPDWDFFMLEPDRETIDGLLKPTPFETTCDKACTSVVTLLPKTNVAGHSGLGYYMINVDGYRTMNAYVIGDALYSSTQRGFTLELSFAMYPFVYGVGVVGETSFFFNFDTYFEPGTLSHRTARCATSDLSTIGTIPWIGGVDQTHILRVPVMGPYVRATVFNEDSTARNVTVAAYLST